MSLGQSPGAWEMKGLRLLAGGGESCKPQPAVSGNPKSWFQALPRAEPSGIPLKTNSRFPLSCVSPTLPLSPAFLFFKIGSLLFAKKMDLWKQSLTRPPLSSLLTQPLKEGITEHRGQGRVFVGKGLTKEGPEFYWETQIKGPRHSPSTVTSKRGLSRCREGGR